MPEQIQNLLNRLIEWWKGLTLRQRIYIISGASAVVLTLGILIFVFTRPTNQEIYHATDAQDAAQVKALLDGETGLWYEQSDDGLTFTIHKDDYAQVWMLLGTNGITVKGYSLADYLEGNGFSTTESDKSKKWQYFLQSRMEQGLASMDNIKSAQVSFNIPKDDGTLQAQKQDASASVILELSGEMSTDQASAIAKVIATSLGNESTATISIMDTEGNLLFTGDDEISTAGLATKNLSVKKEAEHIMTTKVKQILSSNSTGQAIFDNVQVSPELTLDFSKKTVQDFHYYVDEGMSQGYLDSRSEKTSKTTNGIAGVPGTDSNDDTTYVLQDNANSSSETSDVTEDYLPSETITTEETSGGGTKYDDSSITVVAYRNVVYDEDVMKASGQLDGTSFEEVVANNSNNVLSELENRDEIITAISNATHIPIANISLIAYDTPTFRYSAGGRAWTDWLEIALAVLIFLLLGFVAWRSFRKEKDEEAVEEVSVEALLEEQQEELEDIGFNEKSEARLLIEKFVEERPEAVASLLRNWLNEDWGD